MRDLNKELAERVEARAQERDRVWNLSQDLLVVFDSDGNILNVNPAWQSTLGWSPDDLVGKSIASLVHPDDRARSSIARDNLVAGRKTRHFENRMVCKDGSYRWLSWFAVPDRGLIYATGRDITNLKQAQEQLHTLRQEFANASRRTTMGAMTASIAHEIKQPLAVIVTSANAGLRWLKRSEPNLAEARGNLDQIVKAGHRITEVIDGIRAMFGKESGKTSAVDLRQLVGEVLALAQGELETHQIVLRNDMGDGLPQVMATRVQLQQVILNLIMNAVEAMSSVTGRERCLTIAVQPRPAGKRDDDRGGYRNRNRSRSSRPYLRSVLYDQVPRHGPGALHLPVDHRGPWRRAAGGARKPVRHGLSFDLADTRRRLITRQAANGAA